MKELKCEMCGEIIPNEWATDNEQVICEFCKDLSICCGAPLTEEGLCSDCKEHVK